MGLGLELLPAFSHCLQSSPDTHTHPTPLSFSPLPHSSLPLLCAIRCAGGGSRKELALLLLGWNSSAGTVLLLLQSQIGVTHCAPGYSRNRACQSGTKVMEGQVWGRQKEGKGGDLSLHMAQVAWTKKEGEGGAGEGKNQGNLRLQRGAGSTG